MNMTIRVALFLAASAAFAAPADAAPKRQNGQACDSTGTARRTGTDQDGNKLDCLWDTCTYSECSTSGGQVNNCVKKTEYSNARDCKAAARTGVKSNSVISPNLRDGALKAN